MGSGPDSQGYTEVASDGGLFTFGSPFYGSMGGKPLNEPMVGGAQVTGQPGYWTVASDGGVFSFGSAGFYGSTGGTHLNAPIVGMASTPDGLGYWLVASDGGIFAYGDAGFYGSRGRQTPQRSRSSVWLRLPTARATGWSLPTEGSSPTATRSSSGRPAP